MKISKRSIEHFTVTTGFIFICMAVFSSILYFADQILEWNLFSRSASNFIAIIFFAMAIILLACFLSNIMVNLSIISSQFESLADKLTKKDGESAR